MGPILLIKGNKSVIIILGKLSIVATKSSQELKKVIVREDFLIVGNNRLLFPFGLLKGKLAGGK